MKDSYEAMGLVFLWLMVVIYVLIALLLFAHMLSAFVRQWRDGRRNIKGSAHTGRADRRAHLVFDSGVRRIPSIGWRVRPWTARICASPPGEPADAQAQAADNVDGESVAAWRRL
jgi:hypothetical protein